MPATSPLAAAACNEVSSIANPDTGLDAQANASDTAPTTIERRSMFSPRCGSDPRLEHISRRISHSTQIRGGDDI